MGYSKDNLIIPAKYDSISSSPYGNHWILVDKASGNIGLAYVSDSLTRVIEPGLQKKVVFSDRATHPVFKTVNCFGNGLAILKDSLNYSYLINKGEIVNQMPYNDIQISDYIIPKVFAVTNTDGSKNLIDASGAKLSNFSFNSINIDHSDSIIRAATFKEYWLYDFNGKRLADKTFRLIEHFSDGIAWAIENQTDYNKNAWSVIDRNGNILFKIPQAENTVMFSEGIGWYKKTNNNDTYYAVNNNGDELFTIQAKEVYPYTMGLAPIIKENSKLGFINHKRITVIDFKYTKPYDVYIPRFDRDSTMTVLLNGVKGTLHRNGTFTPI